MPDLRERSRRFKTIGTQRLIDSKLNGFGLGLFVESYWDAVEHDLGIGTDRDVLELDFVYRGMRIRIDPTPGLEEDAKRQPHGVLRGRA